MNLSRRPERVEHGSMVWQCKQCGRNRLEEEARSRREARGEAISALEKAAALQAELAKARSDVEASEVTVGELRAMLERCIGGKTDDGYDGGIRELVLSAESDERDGGDRFFANKVEEIHREARALLTR